MHCMKVQKKKSTNRPGNSTFRMIVASAVVLMLLALGASQLLFVSAQSSSDTKEPGDVTTLTATAGDSEITLSWPATTDDVAMKGYRIYMGNKAVAADGDTYDLPTIDTENVTTYTVKNLSNDKPYFFSLTALDAAGNESINYSPEATATPKAGSGTVGDAHPASVEDNGKAPEVKMVAAEDNITVKVEFSEAVHLPDEQPASAFTIQTSETKERLAVQKAEVDSRDSSGATVVLTTAPQTENTNYVLTAGIEVKDLNDNPVISGTSDTGSFKGKAPDPSKVAQAGTSDSPTPTLTSADPQNPEDINADLKVVSGTADFNDRIQLVFSEAIQLPDNPLTAVLIAQKNQVEKKLNVLNVSLSVDGETMYVITEKQNPVEYEVVLNNIKDEKGKFLAADTKYSVTGKSAAVTDVTPPEDATNFIARVKNAQKSIIELKWKPSANTAGDLADYLVYQADGKDATGFKDSSSLGSNTTSVEVQNLDAGKWYSFKMTAKDATGNESKGVFSSVYLPQTGPGMIAAALTGVTMAWYRKRKNRK